VAVSLRDDMKGKAEDLIDDRTGGRFADRVPGVR
jgi:hypothetical protein